MSTQAKYLFLILQGDSSTTKDFPDHKGFPVTDFETYIAPSHIASH